MATVSGPSQLWFDGADGGLPLGATTVGNITGPLGSSLAGGLVPAYRAYQLSLIRGVPREWNCQNNDLMGYINNLMDYVNKSCDLLWDGNSKNRI